MERKDFTLIISPTCKIEIDFSLKNWEEKILNKSYNSKIELVPHGKIHGLTNRKP